MFFDDIIVGPTIQKEIVLNDMNQIKKINGIYNLGNNNSKLVINKATITNNSTHETTTNSYIQ